MVGEDEDSTEPNSFNSKPAWARFLIVAAGPVFNLVFGVLCAVVLVASVGINRPVCYRATGHAAEIGLQDGDTILSLGGKKIRIGRDFALLETQGFIQGELELVWEHDGEVKRAMLDTHYTVYEIGISYNRGDASLSGIVSGSPAEKAGLLAGDRVIGINGTPVADGDAMGAYLQENPLDGKPLELTVLRGGESRQITVVPVPYERNSLGFNSYYYYFSSKNLGEILKYSLIETGYWCRATFSSLKMLVRGQVGFRDMSGVVGIVAILGDAVDAGMKAGGVSVAFDNVMELVVLLNVNLGIMNLLPIPALDGGRLVFIILEMIRRKPIPREKEGMIHLIGLAILMVLMAAFLFSDVLKLFGR